ncbi:inhibitor of growth protein 1 [Zootermopsis nevadensis]|uniref:Inhibitor of growth protein n=1 Tax=Zootermopsis nevadensis TaxID=136037 RepID=A0A067QYV5_ZOONE|nr:inhibitor of growth protein 1 [Zootermopsis nevadensis]KDR15717.1 Inhibitor of growth protein 1 [Zootermopsis nevadensis]
MLNQAAVEALYSATYVENYLDCVENLPDDLQRHLSRMRELDVTYQAFLKEVEQQQESSRRDSDLATKRRILLRIQQTLIAAQEVGDEKLQIVQTIQDLIENKARQLELDYRNLDFTKDQENTEPNRENHHHHHHGLGNSSGGGGGASSAGERQSKRARRSRTEQLTTGIDAGNTADLLSPPEAASTRGGGSSGTTSGGTGGGGSSERKKGGNAGKKKKRKSRQSQQQQQQHVQQQRDESPPHEDELAIDPDEPTYCLCDQISYGEMILCDNDLCPIEWFHFSCVALATKPKGKWYCPKCRGDRPNVMKPKAQFLKELERYNKEKEEKS